MTVWQVRPLIVPFQPMVIDEVLSEWDGYLRLSNAGPLVGTWTAPRIRRRRAAELRGPDRNDLVRGDSDAPYVSGIPGVVLSDRAVSCLRDMLLHHGELLPTICHDAQYWVYHCTNRAHHILDSQRCVIPRFPDGQSRGAHLAKLAFHPSLVERNDIFTLDEPDPHEIYVSDQFRQRVYQHALRGFEFRMVWTDSPAGPYPVSNLRNALSVRQIGKRAAQAVEAALDRAQLHLGVNLETTPADVILDRVELRTQEIFSSRPSMAEVTMETVMLSSLWGQLVCLHLGWSWRQVECSDGTAVGIASPMDRYVVFPQGWFYALLAHGPQSLASSSLFWRILRSEVPSARNDDRIILAG